MVRGQLPKAYLRLDPNIDQTHPDNLDAFIRLLCAANRQPRRGWFRSRAVLSSVMGKSATDRFYARGDVVDTADGVSIPGWDNWQEGDLDVGERVRRFRAKHALQRVTSTVTDAVTEPLPTSEASRRLGSKASTSSDEEVVRGRPRPPTDRQRVFAWLTDHGLTRPSGYVLTDLDGVLKATSADAVIASFEEALSLRAAVTTKNFVSWAEKQLAPNVAPNQPTKPAGHHGNGREIADAFRS